MESPESLQCTCGRAASLSRPSFHAARPAGVLDPRASPRDEARPAIAALGEAAQPPRAFWPRPRVRRSKDRSSSADAFEHPPEGADPDSTCAAAGALVIGGLAPDDLADAPHAR
jgi:hypothetical protein